MKEKNIKEDKKIHDNGVLRLRLNDIKQKNIFVQIDIKANTKMNTLKSVICKVFNIEEDNQDSQHFARGGTAWDLMIR